MKLTDIEGLDDIYAQKLTEAGIKTLQDLLEIGRSPAKRKKLADDTGIRTELILRWVHIADLVRVEGIGVEYANLLEKAGVDTARDLSRRNVENLAVAIERTNAQKNLVNRLPGIKQLLKAIKSASEISPSPHGGLAGDATIDAPPPGDEKKKK